MVFWDAGRQQTGGISFRREHEAHLGRLRSWARLEQPRTGRRPGVPTRGYTGEEYLDTLRRVSINHPNNLCVVLHYASGITSCPGGSLSGQPLSIQWDM